MLSSEKYIKESLIKKFEGFLFKPEASRSIYYFYHKLIIEVNSIDEFEWSVFGLNFCCNFLKNKGRWYFISKDGDFQYEKYSKIFSNKSYLKKLKNDIKTHKNKSIKGIPSKIDMLTNKELIDSIKKYANNFRSFIRFPNTIRSIDIILYNYFSKQFSAVELDNFLRVISYTNEKELSFGRQEEIKILEYAQKIKKEKYTKDSEVVRKYINNLFSEFSWSTCGYYNEKPRLQSDYMKLLFSAAKEDPLKVKNKIFENINLDVLERKQVISSLNKEQKIKANFLSSLIYIKDYYKSSVNEFIYKGEPLFSKISEVLNIKIHDLKNLDISEIVLLLEGKDIDFRYIEKRLRHNVILNLGKDIYILTEENANYFQKTFLDNNQIGQIKGRSASLGKFKGIVNIILENKDFNSFKENEILVTLNTSPDYVPIMKKAGAILTEEGGLTSHAAIVARELKVPCVVGISKITETLKTGDFIEVDAESGIVTVLNK